MNISTSNKIILAYLGVVLIWSSTPLAINWSGKGDHFLYGLTWRMIIGLLCLYTFMMIRKKRFDFDSFNLKLYFYSGLSIYLSMMSVYYASFFINSSLVALVFALSTFVTGIFSVIWLKESSFQWYKIVGLVFAILGLASIFNQSLDLSNSLLVGVSWVLISLTIHSLGGVMFKKYTVGKDIDALVTTTGSLVATCILYLITLFAVEGRLVPINFDSKMMWATLYLGIAGSALGYVMYMYILKKLQANQVALLALVTPVIAMYLGSTLNDEMITTHQIVGTALVAIGLLSYNKVWTLRL